MGKFMSIQLRLNITTKILWQRYIGFYSWLELRNPRSCWLILCSQTKAFLSLLVTSEYFPITPPSPFLFDFAILPLLLVFRYDLPPFLSTISFLVVMLGAVTDSVLEANTRPLRIVYIRYMQFLIVNNTTHKCIN